MKNLYLFWVLALFASESLMSQTVLKNYYHTFKPGDEHHFIISNNTSEGEAGFSKTWDFSHLEQKGELKSHMLLISDVEQSSQIPEANIVLEEFGNLFFFRMIGNKMEQYGTVTKNNTVIKYDKPFVKMVYPFEYGESKEGEFSGVTKTSRSEKKFTGTYSIEVDGYGTLTLPGNVKIHDVVRLKTIKEQTYENASHTSTIVSYKWYCQPVRYPLLTIIKGGQPGKTRTIKTAYYADAASLASKIQQEATEVTGNKISSDVNVYPNPFQKEFTLDYTLMEKGDVEIIVFDNAGKKIKTIRLKGKTAGVHSQIINLESGRAANGMYHVSIQSGGEEIRKRLLKVD
jgi:hypothetical protein